MNPWRAAATSATASGKRIRIASRSASACSSDVPETSMRLARRRSARPPCSASASRTARAAPRRPTPPAGPRTRAARASGPPDPARTTENRLPRRLAYVPAGPQLGIEYRDVPSINALTGPPVGGIVHSPGWSSRRSVNAINSPSGDQVSVVPDSKTLVTTAGRFRRSRRSPSWSERGSSWTGSKP